jgi:hypothetical protein
MSCQVCPPSVDLKTIFAVPAFSVFGSGWLSGRREDEKTVKRSKRARI